MRLSLRLVFFTWTFVVFTFLSFSCIKQNATPILELEGPIRIPSGCTLELPPGTQLFAGAGVQTQEGALWTCRMTGKRCGRVTGFLLML